MKILCLRINNKKSINSNLQMKRFYLHNGNEQQGPFNIEDLKGKNITKQTSVWYEGLLEWTEAGKIDELGILLNTNTPPPYQEKKVVPPPISKPISQTTTEKKQPTKKKSKSWIYITIGIVVVLVIVLSVLDVDSSDGQGNESYQQKVMTVLQMEFSEPTKFLTADGEYNQNFWGDKIKVHGEIHNTATVANYKDALVKVTYYSKTNTVLGNEEYTIYEKFPPHSTVKFELSIENYKDVSTIGWDVINALPSE